MGTYAGSDPGPERRRPTGYWTLRVLTVISIPIVMLSVVTLGFVVWSRTHQDITIPAGASLPLSGVHQLVRNGVTVDVATLTVVQGGRDRTALVSAPTDIPAGERLPVVFLLHGAFANATSMFDEGANGFLPAQGRMIAVFPEGDWGVWNAGACCRPSTILGVDDVAFLQSLVSDMKRRADVDPSRVFMAGFSNGGMMVYRYLCDHADELAGAVSVAGINVSGCEPNVPLPLLQSSGTEDDVVPYDGENSAIGRLLGPWSIPPAHDAIAATVASMGCDPGTSPGPTKVGGRYVITSEDWSGCDGRGKVRFVTYHGMGHWWPVGTPWSATGDTFPFIGLT